MERSLNKKVLLQNHLGMALKLGMYPLEIKYYNAYINDDLGLTLTYFMSWSNFVPYAVKWGKKEKVNFSAAVALCETHSKFI